MKIDESAWTFDGQPTLTDTQVLQFCRDGFLFFEGAVPKEINERTFDYLNRDIPVNPIHTPKGLTRKHLEETLNSNEPSAILLEEWFIEHVLLNPVAAGAVRSLLGKNTGLPALMSNHRVECPGLGDQGWHQDADSFFVPETNYLQVFYYPQHTPKEMGPTEVVPGTHIMRNRQDHHWNESISTASSAGSIFITSYPIVHRRSQSTATGIRNLLKYNYWRTVPPERDWIAEPDFDFHMADYGGHVRSKYYAHMFYWLCGKGDEFRTIGGQSWPYSRYQNAIRKSYGFEPENGYTPDWSDHRY